MFAQPGKKLLFMGDEFGQVREWTHDSSLEWHVLQYPVHRGLQSWVEQLNRVYREQPALHELDNDPAGFEWVDCNDSLSSTISLLRKGRSSKETDRGGVQLHPCAPVGVSLGRSFWRILAGTPEQRCQRLCRQRYGKRGRRAS